MSLFLYWTKKLKKDSKPGSDGTHQILCKRPSLLELPWHLWGTSLLVRPRAVVLEVVPTE